jgi:hypothetical protein
MPCKLFPDRCQRMALSGQLISYKIRTSSFVYLNFFQKSKKKVRTMNNIMGAEFDDVNFSISMRAKPFENSDDSISYVVQPIGDGVLFFGNNRLGRDTIPTDPCLFTPFLQDKDIGAFGICKWKVNSTYICTNAPNHIVTVDLNDTVYPEATASTYKASKSCHKNCSVCNMVAEVCQTPAPNTYNYGYWNYDSVFFYFFNRIRPAH